MVEKLFDMVLLWEVGVVVVWWPAELDMYMRRN